MSDPFDPELSDRLRALGGSAGDDTEAALAALRPRARNARRRRQAALTGGAAAALLAVVAVGSVVAASGDGSGRISTPATQPGISVPSSTTTTTTPQNTTTTTVDPSTNTTVPGGGGPAPSTPTTTGTAPTTTPTTPGPGSAETETQENEGGSVTVRLDNGVLSLVAATPKTGFAIEEQEERADRVRVRFRNDEGEEHRIEFAVDGGQIVVERNE